ncbi:MAG: hypothetical protein EOP50_09160 [Sphingobacteriales bacterium]|nr:MAG: hypothetical protein EOP50_09160 [Sphingobacteriales bacterium]
MGNFPRHFTQPLQSMLIEYATYDSSAIVSNFAREVLLHVYGHLGDLDAAPDLQRSLALRMLARTEHLGRQYMKLKLHDSRSRSEGAAVKVAVRSSTLALAALVNHECSTELHLLSRILKPDDPSFSLHTSFFDPLGFVWALDCCLDVIDATPRERDIVFTLWPGVFAKVMKQTYSKYIQVAENWRTGCNSVRQDFVETWAL